MRRVASTKGAKGRADRAFSKLVRARGYCEAATFSGTLPGCGGALQCAHIISRRFSNTRCDELNAWSLCAGHHLRLTEHPDEHMGLVSVTIGMRQFYELKERALSTRRVDWVAVAADLEAKLRELDQ